MQKQIPISISTPTSIIKNDKDAIYIDPILKIAEGFIATFSGEISLFLFSFVLGF